MTTTLAVTAAAAVAVAALLGMALIRRRDRAQEERLPALDQVGVVKGGILTCPVCSSASFDSGQAKGFVGLAIGPFVFGGLTDIRPRQIICVVCGERYRARTAHARREVRPAP